MAESSFLLFYEKEFKTVLDTLIQQYKENLAKCLKKVKSLSVILLPPLRSNHKSSDVRELLSLFPKQAPDVDAFTAEFEIFVCTMKEKAIKSFAEAAEEAEKMRRVFPLTNRIYRLALTAPVTVAQNERTFSKLKTVKTALRNSTSDARLFNLMLLNIEKDVTDKIDLDYVVEKWAKHRARRI